MSRSNRSSARRSQDTSTYELLRALEELYAEIDRTFAGWSCPASTECCRFGVTGREPYVTSIELHAIERALAARGGARSFRKAQPLSQTQPLHPTHPLHQGQPLRRALPLLSAGHDADERRCPMLAEDNRCAIYASRPLGCRTFYCERATPGERVRHPVVSAFVRRVQEIAARHEPDGDRGRALTRALAGRPAR